MKKPLCIDLFCGLGGWSEGFLAAGYEVVGFDIERHQYWMPVMAPNEDGNKGTRPVKKRGWTQGVAVALGLEGPGAIAETRLTEYPAQLVIQDVLTIHGSQFKDAACIVASPPCQQYSWLAMPWSRSKDPNNSKAAKALRAKWETEGPDNRLFDACFRIQREACEAAGRYIPLIVENVRGAQEWVGAADWSYGSFYLWGDVPALMPKGKGIRVQSDSGRRTDVGKGAHFTSRDCGIEGTKIGGDWFSDPKSTCRKHGSRSKARKAASAQIAKIPSPLAEHIALVFKPRVQEKVA